MATVQPTTRVRAVAKDVHISPQKVRLVIDQVRGKRVNEALAILRFLPQGAAREVARVVRSAVRERGTQQRHGPGGFDHRARICGRRDQTEAIHGALARAAGGDPEAVQPYHDRCRGAPATGACGTPCAAPRGGGDRRAVAGARRPPSRAAACRHGRKRRARSRVLPKPPAGGDDRARCGGDAPCSTASRSKLPPPLEARRPSGRDRNRRFGPRTEARSRIAA